jgi:hypothetical protein
MRRLWIISLIAAISTCPAWAQKVEVQKLRQGQILYIHTALNHLTVLEMNETVSTVAVGSPVFRVDWRQNKVFIEPTEPNVATDLFVWTLAGRFNYELDPAGSVPKMDFAIDQPPPQPRRVDPERAKDAAPVEMRPAQVLLETTPCRIEGSWPRKRQVMVLFNALFEHNGQLFISYTILNNTGTSYTPGKPQAVALSAPRYHESLYVLRNTELSPKDAARLKSKGETPLKVTSATIRSTRIAPGKRTTGIVTVSLPEQHSGPTVLRLVFPAAWTGPVTATLVR